MACEIIEIAGKVRFETDLAYKFDDGSGDPVWLPKSQCEWDEGDGVMMVPEWLALAKGLI